MREEPELSSENPMVQPLIRQISSQTSQFAPKNPQAGLESLPVPRPPVVLVLQVTCGLRTCVLGRKRERERDWEGGGERKEEREGHEEHQDRY